jgi:hypothetical protein
MQAAHNVQVSTRSRRIRGQIRAGATTLGKQRALSELCAGSEPVRHEVNAVSPALQRSPTFPAGASPSQPIAAQGLFTHTMAAVNQNATRPFGLTS